MNPLTLHAPLIYPLAHVLYPLTPEVCRTPSIYSTVLSYLTYVAQLRSLSCTLSIFPVTPLVPSHSLPLS